MSTDIRTVFERDGYYIARGLYSSDEIARMEADFDHAVAQITKSSDNCNARWKGKQIDEIDGGESEIVHTHNLQMFSGVWQQAIQNPAFLDVAEAILGPDIILHHTKLFQKPNETGAPFPIHQDWEYFPTVKDSMIAGIIHVSEATDEMGCLRLVPGSHKLGRRPDMRGQSDVSPLADEYPLEKATIIEAEPGDVAFFHYFTLHGSKPNRSDKTRKTVLVQLYAGDDEVEAGNEHADMMVPLRGWNHRMTRERAVCPKRLH